MICKGGNQGMPNLAMGSTFCMISPRNQCRKGWRANPRWWVIKWVIFEPPAIIFDHGSWFLPAGVHHFAHNTKLVFSFIFTAFWDVHGHSWPFWDGHWPHTEVLTAVGHAGIGDYGWERGGWGWDPTIMHLSVSRVMAPVMVEAVTPLAGAVEGPSMDRVISMKLESKTRGVTA